MNSLKMLINAYYERLYELIEPQRELCLVRIEQVVRNEAELHWSEELTGERLKAHVEAANAFLEERLEMYNPIGLQYAYGSSSQSEVFSLEAALDWYNSQQEYHSLCKRAMNLLGETKGRFSDQDISLRANQMILDCGAYPNQSILGQYSRRPQPNHLPDFAVAKCIEELLESLRFDLET